MPTFGFPLPPPPAPGWLGVVWTLIVTVVVMALALGRYRRLTLN